MTIIDEYIEMAESWGDALRRTDAAAANAFHDKVEATFAVIRKEGQEQALFDRADSVSDPVCLFIASHLKGSDPQKALALYERLSTSPQRFVALTATFVLNKLGQE